MTLSSGVSRHRNAPPAPTVDDARIPRARTSTRTTRSSITSKKREIVRTIETARPYPPTTDPVTSEAFEQIRWFHSRAKHWQG